MGTLPGGGLAGATPGSETEAVNWRSWAPTPVAAAPGGPSPGYQGGDKQEEFIFALPTSMASGVATAGQGPAL